MDQQTINEDPRLVVNMVMADKATHASQTLHSLHVFRCTHAELLKKQDLRVIKLAKLAQKDRNGNWFWF